MKAKDIEEKYGITVLNARMDEDCHLICNSCGHHANKHEMEGTGGICKECNAPIGLVHNFEARKKLNEQDKYF